MRIDLGVYVGGSSMTIAYFRDDKVSVIVNESGDRTTPSVLAINENEFSVGLAAKQNLIRNSRNTILHAKHFICKNSNTLSNNLAQKLECQIKDLNEKEIAFLVEKNEKPYELSLTETIEKLFKYLNDLAKTSLGVKECDAVISAPLHFNQDQSEFLMNCAKKAGFNVLRMVKNPIAACLAYDIEEDNTQDHLILVYQMGGNSIEVTLISLAKGLYRVIDSIYVDSLGGDHFTDIVVDILCEEFQKKHKSDPKNNKRSIYKLKTNAEELKNILSTMERAHCSIDALYDGIDFDYYLTRQRFEVSCNKIYEKVLKPIDDLLSKNKLNENEINKVILSGAATKMCKLQSLVKQKFSNAKLLTHQSSDEIVSLGCAKQCSIITNSKIKNINDQDTLFKCVSAPIYLKVGNSSDLIQLIKANTPIPIKREFNFDCDLNNPVLKVMESEEKLIATISLENFKTKEVYVLFQIKTDETVEITVNEASTSEKISVFLNSESTAES